MSFWSVFLVGVGVSADAFAAALTNGLRMRELQYRQAAIIAVVFAGFQIVMPLNGWLLASQFARVIGPVDHWVAFVLLTAIGAKLVWDAFTEQDHDDPGRSRLGIRRLLLLGLATSIDAAAVGVSFAVLDVDIVRAVVIIGLVTLAMSYAAVFIGHRIGTRFRRPAEFVGGVVLIGIGVRILLEHLTLFG